MFNMFAYKFIHFFFNHDSNIFELTDFTVKEIISDMNVKYSARQNVHNIVGAGGKLYFVSNTRNIPTRIFIFDNPASIELLVRILYKFGFSTGNARLALAEARFEDMYFKMNKHIFCIKMINGFFSVDCVKF